jgi:hypothetical protein
MEYLLFHCRVRSGETWEVDRAGLEWLLGLFAEFHLDVVSHSHSDLPSLSGDEEDAVFTFLVRYVSGSGADLDGFLDKYNLSQNNPYTMYGNVSFLAQGR